MENKTELVIKMVLDAWNIELKRTNTLLNELTDDQLSKEVSPGRNTGVYLLGHLVAVHDALFPLLGLGKKMHPHLEDIFIINPDKSGLPKTSINDLRNLWNEVNSKLSEHFNQFTPEEWFQKHTSVNEEDFTKEPHRNRLNVVISRTNHLSYHHGQLAFLKK